MRKGGQALLCLQVNNAVVQHEMISFVTETTSVYCAVRTECLNVVQVNISLPKGRFHEIRRTSGLNVHFSVAPCWVKLVKSVKRVAD